MSNKIKVGILFGGKSAEHEVSLQSAKNILEAIDRDKYDILLLGIDKQGQWHMGNESEFVLHKDNPRLIALNKSNDHLALIPGQARENLVDLKKKESIHQIDVVFPVLHGPFGEDGTVQGLFKLAGIPFVGAGVLGSAVGMDKDVMKRLLRDADITIADFIAVQSHERTTISYHEIRKRFGAPFFAKPANLGSSVGVHKVHNENEFMPALDDAFRFDTKIIIEEFVDGREIECAVLGNEDPRASVPGEILPSHEFYSYEAKYIDEQGAVLEIPAKVPENASSKIRDISIKAFKTLCCEGMARVDCFLKKDGSVVVNEINTIPGFTSISMYTKLWEASGIPYGELIDQLIQLALARHEKEKGLQSHYSQDVP
ncbi:MAG: D-alanine--D-alanine ligase [Deltaproteobacteria bacterium]|nr:D-alanine--D-alanine ligase [Deltaproteobacteria bacterium]